MSGVRRYDLDRSSDYITEHADGDYVLFVDLAALKSENERLKAALRFYANPKNWTQSAGSILYDQIDEGDCADYPHITRDLRETGGKRARTCLKECGE